MSITVTKVRRIGNSRGILFSKAMLDESGIADTVKVTVKNKMIMITPGEEKRRKSWSYFKKAKRESADFIVNRFDSTEWAW